MTQVLIAMTRMRACIPATDAAYRLVAATGDSSSDSGTVVGGEPGDTPVFDAS